MRRTGTWGLVIAGLVCWSVGCNSASSPAPKKTAVAESSKTGASSSPGGETPKEQTSWPDYPDVPYLPIMTEVDGIEIPRETQKTESFSLTGKVPVDVGNEAAQKSPSQPVSGGQISIRFNSEPQSLNPVTESSAVQTYAMQNTFEALLRQDPETFEFEPHIASKWVTEDSLKLSPTTPNYERRLVLTDGEPAGEVAVTLPEPPKEGEDATVVTLKTVDLAGKPLGKVWVGLYPVDKILGAPAGGFHFWSDDAGVLELSGLPGGKYLAKTGYELTGLAERQADGSVVIKPGTKENALHEWLKEAKSDSLTLKKGEWVDLHQGTIFTYYLRPEVKWSDGTPLTTKDLEFGYAVLNNDSVDGDSLRTYYSDLVECEALGPHTIRMKYRQQYFKAIEFTAGLSAYSPPWHVFQKLFKDKGQELTLDKLTADEEKAQNKVSAYGGEFGRFFNNNTEYNRSPMGTGPYVVSKWDRGDRLELTRNPDYWLKERPGYLDKIVIRFIVDQVTALQAFRSGEIDFVWPLTPEQFFEDLKTAPKLPKGQMVKASWYTPLFGYFGWNMQKDAFKDRRVRIALAMLFDKNEFLQKKLYNAGVVVSGTQYYFGPAYDHEVAPISYDPQTARELLSDAGWVDTNNDGVLDKDGEKMSFILQLPPGNPVADERVQLFQRSLKQVGIELEIRNLEWASFIDKVKKKDFDIVTLSWATSPESDPYQIWHSSGAGKEARGSNHVSFNNPQADELIEMLRVTLDPKKRMRIHQSLHRLLDREQPYMFLYTPMDFAAYNDRYRGVKWYRLRPGFDLSEWYIPKDLQ